MLLNQSSKEKKKKIVNIWGVNAYSLYEIKDEICTYCTSRMGEGLVLHCLHI